MATYLISYDLNKDKDYPKLWAELENFNAKRVLRSQWVFKRVNTNAAGLRDHFWKFMDSNDILLVVDITAADWAGMNLMTKISEL